MKINLQIILTAGLFINQLLLLIVPLGVDGVHGNNFMQSLCEVRPENLELARTLTLISILLTIIGFFKKPQQIIKLFLFISIIFIQISLFLDIQGYIAHHHNPCHEVAHYGVASCDGYIKYTFTQHLPVISGLLALLILIISSRAQRKVSV